MCVTEGAKALLEDYHSGSKERRRLLEKRYGYASWVMLEETVNEKWKNCNTQPCPHCYCAIEVLHYMKTIAMIILLFKSVFDFYCAICFYVAEKRRMPPHVVHSVQSFFYLASNLIFTTIRLATVIRRGLGFISNC